MFNQISAGNIIRKGSKIKLINIGLDELKKLIRFLSDNSSLKYSLQRVLMAINIDGNSISSITIDGNQVQEVTIDGNVVWQGTQYQYADSWEDNNTQNRDSFSATPHPYISSSSIQNSRANFDHGSPGDFGISNTSNTGNYALQSTSGNRSWVYSNSVTI